LHFCPAVTESVEWGQGKGGRASARRLNATLGIKAGTQQMARKTTQTSWRTKARRALTATTNAYHQIGTVFLGAVSTFGVAVGAAWLIDNCPSLALILFALPWFGLVLVTSRKQRIHGSSPTFYLLAWYCFHTLFGIPLATALHPFRWQHISDHPILVYGTAMVAGVASWYLWWRHTISVEDLELSVIRDFRRLFPLSEAQFIFARFFGTYCLVVFLYGIMYTLLDASFANLFNRTDLSFGDFLYFSFVTITTLGYGDIYPVAWQARFLVVTELISGLAVVAVYLGAAVSYLSTGAKGTVAQQPGRGDAEDRAPHP